MSNDRIARRLVELGQDLFQAPKEFALFTKVPEADALLNDIEGHPHAFVLACVMDRQIKAERAWLIPYKISLKIGSPSFDAFSSLSQEEIKDHMSRPEPLHRFVEIMSKYFFWPLEGYGINTRETPPESGRGNHRALSWSSVSSNSQE